MVDIKKRSEIFRKEEKSFSSEKLKVNIENPQNFEKEDGFENVPEKKEEDNDSRKEGELDQIGSISSRQKNIKGEDEEKKIEKILEKDIDDIYLSLDEKKKEEFKALGEKTAKQINIMLQKGKVKFKKIVVLIKKWLLVVPGINKFFLEQEAKLKADEIIKLKNEEK